MNCLECRELIQRWLDGDATHSGPDDLAAHLALCPDCRDLHAAAQGLLDGLGLLAPPQPPPGLLEQICERIVRERIRARRLRRLLATSAVAASLLLTWCAVYFAGRTDSIRSGPPVL